MAWKQAVQIVSHKSLVASDRKFSNEAEALAFLTEAAKDKKTMAHFNEVWSGLGPKGKSVAAAVPKKVLTELAKQMAIGQLRLRKTEAKRASAQGNEQDPQLSASGPFKPGPRSNEQPLFIRRPADPKPARAPNPPVDVDRQIETLLRAAEDGTPFCELCQS